MKANVTFGSSLNEEGLRRAEKQIDDLMGKGRRSVTAIETALNAAVADIPMFFVVEINYIEDGKPKTMKASGSRIRLSMWLAETKLKDPVILVIGATSDRNQARKMAQEV